ncbi:MAG: DNA glycosylase [Acutalibacteraceae bacterium]
MTQYTARLTGAVPFNLQETFECGQCFRWLPGDDGSYTGVVGRNVITLRTDGDDLLVAGLDQAEAEQRLIPYLALDEDYAAIQEQFRRNAQLAQAVDYARGIRVLRQDRWEALCSFIISQNNNIKRIRGIVETLCNTWGEPLPGGRSSFPDQRCWRPSPRRISSRCAAGSGPSIFWMPPVKPPQAKWTWTMWPPCPPRKQLPSSAASGAWASRWPTVRCSTGSTASNACRWMCG